MQFFLISITVPHEESCTITFERSVFLLYHDHTYFVWVNTGKVSNLFHVPQSFLPLPDPLALISFTWLALGHFVTSLKIKF
jgi:hypothetical protein